MDSCEGRFHWSRYYWLEIIPPPPLLHRRGGNQRARRGSCLLVAVKGRRLIAAPTPLPRVGAAAAMFSPALAGISATIFSIAAIPDGVFPTKLRAADICVTSAAECTKSTFCKSKEYFPGSLSREDLLYMQQMIQIRNAERHIWLFFTTRYKVIATCQVFLSE